MAFVLVLVLSISTLITVEAQSSRIAAARVETEQTALLGLQVAIGELQEPRGRISSDDDSGPHR